jgi:flagellum-specific peptidoglycan hydrolase FlgJ
MNVIPPEVIAAAQKAQHNYGVPASISIAQWALESARGRRMPTGSNNPFGIKAVAGQPFVTAMTTEYVKGQPVRVTQNFRKFDTVDQAFDLHAALLAHGKPYQKIAHLMSDPIAYAQALTGIYATDPNYGHLLQAIIHVDDLTQYDKGASNELS